MAASPPVVSPSNWLRHTFVPLATARYIARINGNRLQNAKIASCHRQEQGEIYCQDGARGANSGMPTTTGKRPQEVVH